MTVRLSDGLDHDVHVIDDGTLDTVIMVDGTKHTFSGESTSALRNRKGELTDGGITELAELTLDDEPLSDALESLLEARGL